MLLLNELNKKTFVKNSCYRIIASQFPPINLFEDVANVDEFEALFAIQMLTNPRIQDEIGTLERVPKEQRLHGVPGCGYVMAAFTHVNPNGSRFSNGDFGVYYAAEQLSTALAETIFHKEQFLSYTNEPPQEVAMRSLVARFSADLLDLTPIHKVNPIYSLTDYSVGQSLGLQIKEHQDDGFVYHSVRADGLNYALFKPNSIHHCQQGAHFGYLWNGTKITDVYQKKIKKTG